MRRVPAALLAGCAIALALPAVAEEALRRRGHLGFRVEGVPSKAAGLLVTGVTEGSAAAKAGLRKGDRVLEARGRPVSGVEGYLEALAGLREGDPVILKLRRAEEALTLTLAAEPLPLRTDELADVRYGSVKAGDARLRTLLTTPKDAKGPFPVLFFIPGYGGYSIDWPEEESYARKAYQGAYEALVSLCAAKGYAVMWLEISGMGDSEGPPWGEIDFKTQLAGYEETLKALKADPCIDSRNVFVLGQSMGGAYAPLAASAVPVKGVVALCTASRSWMEHFVDNARRNAEAGDPSRVDYEAAEDAVRKAVLLHSLRMVQKKSTKEILAEHPELAEDLDSAGTNDAWMHQLADADFTRAWKALDAHVLAIWGDRDMAVSRLESERIAAIVNRYHPGKGSFHVEPGLGHGFSPGVLVRIVDWMETVVKGTVPTAP